MEQMVAVLVRLGFWMLSISAVLVWGGTCLREAQQTTQLGSCLRLGLRLDCTAPVVVGMDLGEFVGAAMDLDPGEMAIDVLTCRQRRQEFIARCGQLYGDES